MRAQRVGPLLVIVALLAAELLVVPHTSAAAPHLMTPEQPAFWRLVLSDDGLGGDMYPDSGGTPIAHWPGGTPVGVFGDAAADAGPVWMHIQDPNLQEGWVVADALAHPPERILTNFVFATAGSPVRGGVQPSGPPARCPPGFPIKADDSSRDPAQRIVRVPGDVNYTAARFTSCFRALEEAAAWGYAIPGTSGKLPTEPYPSQPDDWRVAASQDHSGVTMYDAPEGQPTAHWPDGTELGYFGDTAGDPGPVWLRVQDPLMQEGWMRSDRLGSTPEPVHDDNVSVDGRPLGGVLPLGPPAAFGILHCPSGFSVKAVIAGREGRREAVTPESSGYDMVFAMNCFRSVEEARAWGYTILPT